MFYPNIREAMEAAIRAKGAVPAKPVLRRRMFTLAGEQHRRDLPAAVIAVMRRGQSS